MNLPKPIKRLIEAFERLPGIGPKTAARLTFYLLHVPQEELDEFAQSLSELKKNTILCSVCFNVSESDPCPICFDRNRDKGTICVVEQPLDVLAIEKTGKYKGVYHVLHGVISPLDNIGPDELYIRQLINRVKEPYYATALRHSETSQRREASEGKQGGERVKEVILALNPDMEGEATCMYLKNQFRISNFEFRISRLGQGLPTGGDLEYADEVTLQRAMEGRREY